MKYLMNIELIKSEADYQNALKQIDQLIDCADNSEQADELNRISILVENYESEHYSIAPPDPII